MYNVSWILYSLVTSWISARKIQGWLLASYEEWHAQNVSFKLDRAIIWNLAKYKPRSPLFNNAVSITRITTMVSVTYHWGLICYSLLTMTCSVWFIVQATAEANNRAAVAAAKDKYNKEMELVRIWSVLISYWCSSSIMSVSPIHKCTQETSMYIVQW